ncbi:MAG: exodeoxyribonuclease V subunit gamma [Propionibacteriaceae bacterium]|nr:exodeoxyribonuclease V subunit gamma [Propionibacteriaceae bacterium]
MLIRTAGRWDELVDGLAAWLDGSRPGVFDAVHVLTASAGEARLAGQALAARIGICAGIQLLPADRWVGLVQTTFGDGEPSPWQGRTLELGVREVLSDPEFHQSYPILRRHLDAGPDRLRGASQRLARLLRQYVQWQPNLLRGWLDDPDEAAETLPAHLGWQPELFLRVCESLEWDPVEEHERLRATLAIDPSPATAVLHCPELPTTTVELLTAIAERQEVPVFRLPERDPWLPEVTEEPKPALPESITWLRSHGPARQAEVLRDELCRLLSAHPDLEPRDILVVVPDTATWWPVLSLAFSPATDPHPGRSLRLQRPAEVRPPNTVLQALATATRLRDSRAEASLVLDLLTLPPIAHRWRLPDRAALAELLAAAGIRWGLDAQHRAAHGLPGVAQNTWARGLDRLLIGLALPPGSSDLPLTGADGIASSQLELIGSLSELLSRLRRYAALTAEAAPTTEWVRRVQELMRDLVGLPSAEEALLQEAATRLAGVATEASQARLTAADFAHLLDQLAAEAPARPAVGNGNLTVVGEDELAGVGFAVVALLGVADQPDGYPPDALVAGLPDPRQQRLERLERHARAARHLVVVHQHRTEATNAPRETPTTLAGLWRRLGIRPEPRDLPASATNPGNFLGETPSFDAAAHRAAELSHAQSVTAVDSTTERRRAALALPLVADTPAMSLDEVVRFLRDPAAAFLRERAGIRDVSPPEVVDDLTLQPGGLDVWGIRSRLLTAARTGREPTEAVRAEARSELLPAGPLSAALIDRELELIRRLWLQARPDWERPVRDADIDLELSGLRLTGSVRLRGDELVVLSPSDLPRPLFEPWVQLLALAASGSPARARVHFLRRHYSDHYADVVTLTPPPDAGQHLAWLVRGARLSRSRLIPVPAEPARHLASAQRGGRLNLADWRLPTTHWNSPWAWRPRHWEHFYAGPAAELFADPLGEFDPPGPEQFGAFGAWALALHSPLLEATQ